MGLSRTVSEINDNFSRELLIFPTPVYLMFPMKELTITIKFIISVAHCRLDFTINSRIQI